MLFVQTVFVVLDVIVLVVDVVVRGIVIVLVVDVVVRGIVVVDVVLVEVLLVDVVVRGIVIVLVVDVVVIGIVVVDVVLVEVLLVDVVVRGIVVVSLKPVLEVLNKHGAHVMFTMSEFTKQCFKPTSFDELVHIPRAKYNQFAYKFRSFFKDKYKHSYRSKINLVEWLILLNTRIAQKRFKS